MKKPVKKTKKIATKRAVRGKCPTCGGKVDAKGKCC